MITYIPSPTVGALHLGPLAIRGYALCILTGIVVAVWLAGRRLEHRGGKRTDALDIATWAVPFGIVGARIYHVLSSPEAYFGADGRLIDALKIWQGGLSVWGAIALGALGAWIGCRRAGVGFLDFADSAAPGIAIAQALGRWGNWFNNEVYGERTDVPWAVQIHQWDTATGSAVKDASGDPVVLGTFHPTFLYEAIFCLLLAIVLLMLDRRRAFAPGQLFALYVAGYPTFRIVLEKMRTDQATIILGQRINVWTSIAVFLLGVALYAWAGRRSRRGSAVSQGEKSLTTS
ncbi:MAG: prolipoprotein diacylglyceryl transferase [Actinobacteria bacterium]|nr:prolipoprotein diacylglyceryl transferase [Actinomycetota bacterium]